MDIDDFELGRKNFDILHVISLEMKDLKQDKADKKARKEADKQMTKLAPHFGNRPCTGWARSRQSRSASTRKIQRAPHLQMMVMVVMKKRRAKKRRAKKRRATWKTANSNSTRHQSACHQRRKTRQTGRPRGRGCFKKRKLIAKGGGSPTPKARWSCSPALRRIGQGQEQLAQVLDLLVPAIARLAAPQPPPPHHLLLLLRLLLQLLLLPPTYDRPQCPA
jgi:hypothetical protein